MRELLTGKWDFAPSTPELRMPSDRVKDSGLVSAGFHDLRRASATALVAGGMDVKTAQARLRHSDPRLTLGIYAQATSAGDRAAAELLGKQFLGASRTQRARQTGTETGNSH